MRNDKPVKAVIWENEAESKRNVADGRIREIQKLKRLSAEGGVHE